MPRRISRAGGRRRHTRVSRSSSRCNATRDRCVRAVAPARSASSASRSKQQAAAYVLRDRDIPVSVCGERGTGKELWRERCAQRSMHARAVRHESIARASSGRARERALRPTCGTRRQGPRVRGARSSSQTKRRRRLLVNAWDGTLFLHTKSASFGSAPWGHREPIRAKALFGRSLGA